MGHDCNCGHDHHHHKHEENPPAGGHCGCGHDHEHAPSISPEDRKKLEDEIAKAGFEVKDDAEGNIIITRKSK